MRRLKLLSAAAALAAILAVATSGTALAGRGYGPCTQPGNSAVGAAGPAMNGGQLMAGVGQCGRIAGSGYHYRSYYPRPDYRWGAPAYVPDYGPDDY